MVWPTGTNRSESSRARFLGHSRSAQGQASVAHQFNVAGLVQPLSISDFSSISSVSVISALRYMEGHFVPISVLMFRVTDTSFSAM